MSDGERVKRDDDTTEWHMNYLAWNFFLELQDAFPPMIHLFSGISVEENQYCIWLANPQDALVEEVSDEEDQGPNEENAEDQGTEGKGKGK